MEERSNKKGARKVAEKGRKRKVTRSMAAAAGGLGARMESDIHERKNRLTKQWEENYLFFFKQKTAYEIEV